MQPWESLLNSPSRHMLRLCWECHADLLFPIVCYDRASVMNMLGLRMLWIAAPRAVAELVRTLRRMRRRTLITASQSAAASNHLLSITHRHDIGPLPFRKMKTVHLMLSRCCVFPRSLMNKMCYPYAINTL